MQRTRAPSSGGDTAYGIAVDPLGVAFVAGLTGSADFPSVDALQSSNNSQDEFTAFVACLNSAGTALGYSTYLGGTGDDQANGIAVDASDNAYVAGKTTSPDFPTVSPLQATPGGRLCGRGFATSGGGALPSQPQLWDRAGQHDEPAADRDADFHQQFRGQHHQHYRQRRLFPHHHGHLLPLHRRHDAGRRELHDQCHLHAYRNQHQDRRPDDHLHWRGQPSLGALDRRWNRLRC